MIVSQYLNEQEQEQILCTLVTDFTVESFKKHLIKGLILTPKVVYLAYCRWGKEGLDLCFFATKFNEKAALMIEELYGNSDDFWANSLWGNKNVKVGPCYLMGFYACRQKTLLYMGQHNLWNEIMQKICLRLSVEEKDLLGEVVEWLKENAPKEWLQKSGLI